MNTTSRTMRLIALAGLAVAPGAAWGQAAYRAVPLAPGEIPLFAAAPESGPELDWTTIDGGGGRISGGSFVAEGTVGQFDTMSMLGGPIGPLQFEMQSGFWAGIEPPECYANCDGSTLVPVLNVADFGCFLNKFAANDPYANCDGSTTAPQFNVADFGCFLTKFAAGCS